MVSRLDRLFILLDTGSSESIRFAAARQIGEVQRVQPHDIGYLLSRIKEYSCKPNWETRIAAGHAIGCILGSVQEWPNQHVKIEQDQKKQQIVRELVQKNIDTDKIFLEFDLNDIVNNCPTLLSTNNLDSDDLDVPKSSKSSKARGRKSSLLGCRPNKDHLLRQRQLINKELGMAMADSLGVGVKSTDIISNDDLQVEYPAESSYTASKDRSAAHMLRDRTSQYATLLDLLREADCISRVAKDELSREDSGEANLWPLTDIVKYFEDGLFDASWETRHGSAISLREIVKLQGKCAGRRAGLTVDINDKLNELWLIGIALKTVCVLSLDRFGDFLFDQVIAPVRENAAQLLGCCMALLSDGCSRSIIDLLVQMLSKDSWEIRHGGMLGIKYSLAVLEKNLLKDTTCRIFDSIFKCLADTNDDVSAEAAATLVLIKDILLETIPDKTPELIKFLWKHIADLDELTSSTSNIILLLASLITANSTQLDLSELNDLISMLWPLLNHPSTSVRISVLKALITLTKLHARPCPSWMPEDLLAIALRLIFQRSILENMEEVHQYIKEAWMQLIKVDSHDEIENQEARTNLLKCTSLYLNYWFCLTMQPLSTPIDRGYCLWLNIRSDGGISDTKPDGEIHIGSSTFSAETIDLEKTQISKCRALGTQLLGSLYSNLTLDGGNSQHPKDTLKYLSDMFVHYLSMKSANSRMISAWTLESWASHHVASCDSARPESFLPEAITHQLYSAARETTLCYDETASAFTRLQQQARDFALALKNAGIGPQNTPTASDKRVFYNLAQIQSMCDLNLEFELSRVASKKLDATTTTKHDITNGPSYQSLVDKKHILSRSYQTAKASLKTLSVSTLSSIACALIAWDCMPEKLSLLIDPLLDSVESEVEAPMQDKSIKYLIRLFDRLCRIDDNQELLKIILDRLVGTIYSYSLTLVIEDTNPVGIKSNSVSDMENRSSNEHRIILLDNLQRKAERMRNQSRRQSSVSSTTATLKRSHSQTSTSDDIDSDTWELGQQPDVASRMAGARKTLSQLVSHFGENLPVRIHFLWQTISQGLKERIELYDFKVDETNHSSYESTIVKDLIVLQVVSENLDRSLSDHLSSLPDYLIRLLSSPNPMIRHQASQCLGIISKSIFSATEPYISQKIIPLLESNSITSRCGAIETIALIIEHLNLDLLPKMDMFIVHVLRRMSDQNDQVRMMATHCFGKLLSLMPLTTRREDKATVQDETTEKKCDIDDNFQFIEQLLDLKKLRNHKLQFETTAELRSYQQEGLNWLAFLNRFNLHGILCDEMGLGKTFMTICMIASDHYKPTTTFKDNSNQSPSLIVCPPTLIEHWLCEIEKFIPVAIMTALNPVGYRGGAHERISIRDQLLTNAADCTAAQGKRERSTNLVVTSYEVLRNDIDFFKSINWNYCVLDEGHIIKNCKTKLSRAIRLITAKHRLILSGTPIQNNVTELWSLFDFLMPGFLGSERQFSARYARPILQSREPKCTSKELEAGALAMESLHRQVLPFVLRRQKEDVLDDLPPKILQDYYCELSPLQSRLYEDFTHGKLCKDVTKRSVDKLSEEDIDSKTSSSKKHVFQALHYLKCVCNHPKLVLSPKHTQYSEIKKYLEVEKSSLDDISHSSKLTALKQLLVDCGIVNTEEIQQSQQKAAGNSELELSIVSQHRALIFCQLRSMVEIIENDLFKRHMPTVTYLKLDGSIPTNQRQSIVSRFNNDPSIDVLLLTTHIGGLGLNLTGADTVIFVEHDWNPARDLQAMDRAHRIGQKKVVNVYRLITKETLEEKIMGLQKFKTLVSNTVINQDNTGLGTMNVDQLLDLFDSGGAAGGSGSGAPNEEQKRKGDSRKSSVADLLPDLWDQQQYETEYDLDNFVASLKS